MSVLALALALAAAPQAVPPTFERRALDDVFYGEGAAFGDLDGDGARDVVSGPYWYAGPDFEERYPLYPAQAFDPLHYSDFFFAWTRDLDDDGDLDVLAVGFPGKEAFWLENPGRPRDAEAWTRHPVFASVNGESPWYADLVGDAEPELVFLSEGRIGYARPDPDDPRAPWAFTPVTGAVQDGPFVHGLGVGDVDGDGRNDVLWRGGWFRQTAATPWERHDVDFARGGHGGAQMLVMDVDGDGDADVVTSRNAHGVGLSWFEQTPSSTSGAFTEHVVMDAEPKDNPRGWRVTELHALAAADIDGDGVDDVVTGKRWWAHGPEGSPGAGDPADLLWFRTVRRADGVELVPHSIDCDSGVGTQVTAGDVDGDGRCDVVVGNKKGTLLFLQRDGGRRPTAPDGRPLNLGLEAGDLTDWHAEGDAFAGQPVRGDTVVARDREPCRLSGDRWIGGYELAGDAPTGRLTSAPFRIDAPYLSFLVGGGASDATRVELARVGDAEPFFTTSGANSETMGRVVVDVRDRRTELVEVRLVDAATGAWGHLNFDDLRLHDARPPFPADPRVPAILPADPVANAGLSPTAAVHAMTVPDGFRVSLVASEPDLVQPIAFTFDAQGRIWVVEARSYPTKRPDGAGEDAILVLADRDRNGSFETRTVFADGLNLVSGIAVGFGGVFVGQAPELLFLPDRDDDLVPDGPAEVLLDGWGYEDTHETLNAFTWGPDGWLYGCHGVYTHSAVGRPGTPDEERVPLNAGVWRYHPQRAEFEVFAEGTSNPWGVDFDAYGEAFITACVIPHLYHVVPGGRYQRQSGSHFDPHTYDDVKTIADHVHWLGGDPHGGNGRSSAAGGGHAHCGAMIYQADLFPAEWRGRIFMSNIHGNRLNTDVLEPRGSGYVGRHGEDFLLANDAWFRAVGMQTGPDGAVYVIDWYDGQACHHKDPAVWDRSNGRMYRVSYGAPRALDVDLAAMDDAALARMQLHENEWYARRARILLQERGRSDAVESVLRPILWRHDDVALRLRALWTLDAVGALTADDLVLAARDGDEHVRAWAARLAGARSGPGETGRIVAERLLADRSPVVRRALASSAIQRGDVALAAVLARTADGAEDPNLPLLLWYGVAPMVADDPAAALQLARETEVGFVARSIQRRAGTFPAGRDALVAAMVAEPDAGRRLTMLEQLEQALAGQRDVAMPAGWRDAYARLAADAPPEIRQRLQALAAAFGDAAGFPLLRRTLADAAAPAEEREHALDALVRGRDAELVPMLYDLLADDALRGPALRALASFPGDATPARVLALYGTFGAEERRDARNTLAGRPDWARPLLEAVRDDVVPRGDVGAYAIRQIRQHGVPELDALVAEVWGAARDTPAEKAERIVELQTVLTPDVLAGADLPRGRGLFAKTCMQCHALFGTGGEVGPDLTGSNRADLDYLLHNMVDPSAEVGRDYQATVAWLTDGRIVTGILREETDSALVLRTENETVVVARSELDEARPSEVSMMPDGLLDGLSGDEVRDLVAYLAAPAQVPRLLLPGEAVFDGATLAGWRGDAALWSVEDGAIVGRAPDGLERNAFLRSEAMLRDFRLTLEVLLPDDAANSGVQFRSRELAGGDVAGYQADVGRGWWGKLYEEHGRGLLVDLDAAEHVRRGDWNAYEITAVGSRVTLRLNGAPCAELVDPDGAREGILALQIHSGGPTEVRFRDLRVELDPLPEPPSPQESSR
jgi:putative membrane-bound dehydrogenase-like protein